MMRKIPMTTLFAVALFASMTANAASENECRKLIRSAGFNPNQYVLVSVDDADSSDNENYEFVSIAADDAAIQSLARGAYGGHGGPHERGDF